MSVPSIPSLDLLLGDQAAEILGTVVAEYDAELTDLQVADAHVAPTGGARVRYVGKLRRADGGIRSEVLVAATGDRIPTGAAVLTGDFGGASVDVGVWRWPQDPVLPGLMIATHRLRLTALLTDRGLPVPADPRIAVRAYRPGHRAVLELSSATDPLGPRWFLKVVAPSKIPVLQRRHALLSEVLPVPPIVATSEAGVIVLPVAPGTVLRHLVAADGPADSRLPSPSALQQVLDTLPAELASLPAHRGHLQRIEDSARVLELTTRWSGDPALMTDAAAVADQIRTAPTPPSEPPVPVHGDFYESQVLVDDGQVTGLIDVDSAGSGERADEWANLLGHLSVLGIRSPRAAAYCTEILSHAEHHTDPDGLRVRTAAVVFGLATGPFRAQRDGWHQRTAERLDLARHWLAKNSDCRR